MKRLNNKNYKVCDLWLYVCMATLLIMLLQQVHLQQQIRQNAKCILHPLNAKDYSKA